MPKANDPNAKNGLFNGQYGGFNKVPSSQFSTTLNLQAARVSATLNPILLEPIFLQVPNAFGFSGNITLIPHAVVGWVGYAQQRYIGKGDGDVWKWLVGVAFPDLGRKGDLGGILVGVEPKLTSLTNDVNGGQPDRDKSFHVEGFYRFRLSDNIAVTPGIIWLTAPNYDDRNDDIFIAVLRTVFYF